MSKREVMRNVLKSLNLLVFFMLAPAWGDEQSNDWIQNECELVMNGYPALFDVTAYRATEAALGSMTNPQAWIGRSYSFEEMLALTGRQLQVLAPESYSVYQAWVKDAFFGKWKVAISQEQVEHPKKFKSIKPSVKRIRSMWKWMSKSEAYRNGNFYIRWKSFPIRNEAELFQMGQEVLEVLVKIQYHHLRGFKSFLDVKGYFKDNFELIKDQLLLQYVLQGERGVEPSGITMGKESLKMIKSMSLDFFWPHGPQPTKINSFYAWVIERYGVQGLSQYLYSKNGLKAGLNFMVSALYRAQVVTATILLLAYTGKMKDVYQYYRPATQIEKVQEKDREEARRILELMQPADGAPVLPPPSVGTESPVIENLSPQEKKEFDELMKDITREQQDSL